MRRFRPSSTPRLSLVCLPALLAFPLAAQNPTSSPPFVESIEVREVEVRVDLSTLPRFESIGRKGQEDFIVVEDGIAYPLTELGSTKASQWIFVLYFDSTLAGPEARQRAAIELAGQSERLTAGGLAEIVVADPLPHTLLSTASADALRRQLDELALAAGKEVARAEPSLTAATAARLAQLDRLAVEIAARGGGGARALLLPVGAWPGDPGDPSHPSLPETLSRLTRSKTGAGTDAPEFRPLVETAQVLAGYGWVTLPLALRAPREEIPLSAAEKRMQVSTGGAGDRRQSVPIVTLPARDAHPDSTTETQLDVLTDFSLMPFAELSRATSGALIGQAERLQSALARLTDRRQFTYRSPFPEPGRLLPLEVRWKGGDGRALSAPRWLRSSTPPEVSAVRLRRLLAGDAAPPGTGIRLGLATQGVCFSGDGEKHWVRLSTAIQVGDEIRITAGKPVQLERGANGFCIDPPAADASGNGRSVLLAEDLETESWTGSLSPAN